MTRWFRAPAACALALLLVASAPRAAKPARATLRLDGERTAVSWTDGDSFRIREGPHRGRTARVVDYNTLEAYGPVHRWGTWSARELLGVALAAVPIAASGEWECTSLGKDDAYGRLLVRCPAAARALVERGNAMVFAIDAAPDPALLAAQHEAQKARLGMWKGGVPARILTSVHSAAEGEGYDRLADTRTGTTSVVKPARVYATCEEVCRGEGTDRSCMVYVPYERRYRNRPPCLM